MTDHDFDVAIVGMACRLPGAGSVAEFWRNLAGGVESISRLSDEQLIAAGVDPEVLRRPDYVKAAPVIDGPDRFDAGFFGYTPAEAAAIDPQQRLLLELAHTALEDAACDAARFRGRIGVFAGTAMNTYFLDRGLGEHFAENYIPTLTANDKDFLATRISYKLGLRGPSLTVQTACSTSLVAIHLARQSLLSEETDLVLAGAASVRVPHRVGYRYDGSGVVSADGRVRAFDAEASGTVFGSGGGMVALKRLKDALADGGRIYAVIKGSAINNDGAAKAGYTAPSVDGQAEVVIEALANAGIGAEQLSYVEAHGSGTALGDRIEVAALTKAFRHSTPRVGFCALGSVKTNVGHLDAAAGMAGLIKTALALQHRQLPPTLNFRRPQPEIDFASTPFVVQDRLSPWTSRSDAPRCAGVMATGMGGTNALVVLEEAPMAQAEPAESAGPHLWVLSARTAAALNVAASQLAAGLAAAEPPPGAAAVARVLQRGRRVHAHRRFVVARSVPDGIEQLAAPEPPPDAVGATSPEGAAPVVMLFPGVGDQFIGMGAELYRELPKFREELDRCAALAQPLVGADLRELLYPRGRAEPPTARQDVDFKRMLGKGVPGPADPLADRLDRTRFCHPALFAIEYALARQWLEWGVTPARLAGHSMGEYVAACLAGVFSLPDAMRAITARARLVNELPQGAMLAVLLAEAELAPQLEDGLSIALINGPKLCVVAGDVAAIRRLQTRLAEQQVIIRPVRNGHAFHSRMLDPIVEPLARELGGLRLNRPSIPFISNVTGTWITPEQATDPRYWADQARRTARFGDALAAVWALPRAALLEVGPGRTLGALALQHPSRPRGARPTIASSLRHHYESGSDRESMLQGAGRLWTAGVDLAWDKMEPGRVVNVSLPTYPFERESHWWGGAAHRPNAQERGRLAASPSASGRCAPPEDWFYAPTWKRADLVPAPGVTSAPDRAQWLLIGEASGLARELCRSIEARHGAAVLSRPRSLSEWLALLDRLPRDRPLNIVHAEALAADQEWDGPFLSLLACAQALGEWTSTAPVKLAIVTRQGHDVDGGETPDPAMALAWGLGRAIPRELPRVGSFAVDLPALGERESLWAEWIGREFEVESAADLIAYRGRHRWAQGYESRALRAAAPPYRRDGVYLITGGAGGIGLAIARHLAKTCRARLILTSRSRTGVPDEVRREIEAAGGSVEVARGDVADRADMERIMASARARHGALHGIFHCAGVLRDGLIALKTREAAAEVLRPKVQGAIVLQELARAAEGLDFLVLFSSLAAVAPLPGQSDYCAANAFLDALASAVSGGGPRTLAINWATWRSVGLFVNSPARAGLERSHAAAGRSTMATDEALEALDRALASGCVSLVVCPDPLEAVRRRAAALTVPESAAPDTMPKVPPGPSPAEGQGEVEEAVAEIWRRVMGLPSIGRDQPFLELGGHSLLAMQIVSQLRTAFQVNYTLRNFFDTPTIAGTAAAIHAELVAELERLGTEEAKPCAAG